MYKNKIKVSVVVTVKNDEEGVKRLLADLERQTVRPDEVVIVKAEKDKRGGKENKDLERWGKEGIKKKIIYAGKNCSRGRGRNIGVRMARNELIAVTDVGCRPRREWMEKMASTINRQIDKYPNRQMATKAGKAGKTGRQAIVIAGWYRAVAETEWQKAFLPYLVPKVRPVNFLPASRSIAFTKKAWELVGGYPEEPVSGGEDLKFADNLYKNPEVNIIFAPDALVDWPVPEALLEFAKDIVKHTRGNFEAGYWPHIYRNLSVVARWVVMAVWPWVIPIYLIVAVFNKGQALREQQGLALRMITARLVADAAVVYGTVIGIIDEWVIKKLRLRASDG